MTVGWAQLRHHPAQQALWACGSRFVAVAAGRGSGKTELAKRRVVLALADVAADDPDPMYFYALPTFQQAKRVAWKSLKRMIPEDWLACPPNESELRIDTVFGSSLYLIGMDKPQRIEGNQWNGGVVDESCDQKPGSFDKSIYPALTHKQGWCWRIGVPKRFGVGAKEFKRVCQAWASSDDLQTASYTWESTDIVADDDLEWAREHLDERTYNEQFLASWETAAGLVFHAFSRANVMHTEIQPQAPLIIGSDFNVDPMSWVIGQASHTSREVLLIHDELFMRNTHTGAALDELHRRYGDHPGGFAFYGDASGRARKSNANVTDYQLIEQDTRFGKKLVDYPSANPTVADRFAMTNALMCNANNQRRLFINPRCKHLIEDVETRAYKEGTREPDDHGDVGHMTDALGYPIVMRYPLDTIQGGRAVVTV